MQLRGRTVDFRIGAPQILLLKAALSPDKAAAAAALEEWWADIADFDDVRGTDSGLFPRIYWNLGSQIGDARLAARLKGAARHHWVKNQYLITGAGDLLAHLNQAGVPVLLMKGAAIAATIDDDPGLRAMSDCDMLVPRDQAVEVLAILAASGLLEKANVHERDLDVVHGVTLRLRNSEHGLFDIHWRPLRAVGAGELAVEMFANARPVRFAGQSCLAPCPEHLLFHAVVHGAEWSPFPRYDWLVDTIKILRRTGTAFDWEKLANLALEYRFAFLMRAALREVGDKGGIAIPAWVQRRLRRPMANLERLETRIRLSKPSALSVSEELLLALQAVRRRNKAALSRTALSAVPTLLQSLYGTLSGSRSFIDNDRKQRITFLQGWSAPELLGRWTEGHLVSFAIYAPERPRPTTLRLRGLPLPARAAAARVVDVFAGPRRLGRFTWLRSGVGAQVQAVELPTRIWRGDTAVVRFRVRTPISPISIGLNGDVRALGISVQDLSVDPVTRDAADRPMDVSADGPDRDVLWHGWSSPEQQGCWTVGSSAIVYWRAAREIGANSSVLVEGPMTAPGPEKLRGRWRLNKQPAKSLRRSPTPEGFRLKLTTTEKIAAGETIEIKFTIANPRSPAETMGTADERILGLCVRRIWIESAGFQP